jgi:D-amino peptidase
VWLPLLDETCDATALIGAHAKASSPPATNYHTMSKAVKDWSVNGVSIGEMGLQALIAGHFGVPMCFVSGEWHACREAEELLPGVVTAAVKRGLSRRSALAWPPARACDMVRKGAKMSLKRLAGMEPLRLELPLLFRDERYAEMFVSPSKDPSVRVIDHSTREIQADDVLDLMQKIYGHPRDFRCPSLVETAGEPDPDAPF